MTKRKKPGPAPAPNASSVSRKRLAEIAAIPDSKIDTSDIPEAGPAFFSKAEFRDGRTYIETRAVVGKLKLQVGAVVPPPGSRLKGAGKVKGK